MRTLQIQLFDIVRSLIIFFFISFYSFGQSDVDKISIGEKKILRSKILQENRTILISLPDNYMSSDKLYPVLYLLDGSTHFKQAIGATDFLSKQGLSPEHIIVAIINIDRNRDFTPVSNIKMPTSGGGKVFHEFLENELVPLIEKSYKASKYKILMGHSLGGMFTAYSFLEFPNVFNAYICVSPYLQYENNYIVKQAKSKVKSKYSNDTSFFMTIGNEPAYLDSLEEFSKLIKKNTNGSLKFSHNEMRAENHMTTPYLSLFKGLRYIFSDWILPKEKLAQGLPAIDSYFDKLSEKYKYKIVTPENIINMLGYQSLQKNEIEDAIEIFKENCNRFPTSANVYDSLGEAYENKGLLKLARDNYEKAFNLGTKQNHRATEIYEKNLQRVSM